LPAHTKDRFYEDSFVIALGKAQERGILDELVKPHEKQNGLKGVFMRASPWA
jgi:hypothetical protein